MMQARKALLAVVVILVAGCAARQPELVGKWKGAPQIREAVKDATRDARINPVAQNFAEALAQKAADSLLGVAIDFKSTGRAFFSGNTDALGIPRDADGPWEILQTEDEIVIVKLAPADSSFPARLAFRDRDTFTFTRLDQKDPQPVVFTRAKD